MLGDWFRGFELPISFAEFLRLPRHPAYKYEYFGGRALLTPRPRYQRAMLELEAYSPLTSASSLLTAVDVRPLQADDWARLPGLLAAAFHDLPPFVALSEDLRPRAAQECLEHTRAGGHGPLVQPACVVAVDAGHGRQLVGAIVITLIATRDADPETVQRPHLTWILVHPWRHRQGLGSKLLAHAVTVLKGLGYLELASTFLVGNERAALWHWRNGFALLPG